MKRVGYASIFYFNRCKKVLSNGIWIPYIQASVSMLQHFQMLPCICWEVFVITNVGLNKIHVPLEKIIIFATAIILIYRVLYFLVFYLFVLRFHKTLARLQTLCVYYFDFSTANPPLLKIWWPRITLCQSYNFFKYRL